MLKVMLLTIVIAAPLSALISSYIQYRLQYNLWDWLKDKVFGFFGWQRKEVLYFSRLARVEAQAFEAELLKLPREIRDAIRRRV